MNRRVDPTRAQDAPPAGRPAETGPNESPDDAERGDRPSPRPDAPETAREPVPGIEHEPEPDGENIIPAKDRPGTL